MREKCIFFFLRNKNLNPHFYGGKVKADESRASEQRTRGPRRLSTGHVAGSDPHESGERSVPNTKRSTTRFSHFNVQIYKIPICALVHVWIKYCPDEKGRTRVTFPRRKRRVCGLCLRNVGSICMYRFSILRCCSLGPADAFHHNRSTLADTLPLIPNTRNIDPKE